MGNEWIPGIPQQVLVLAVSIPLMLLLVPVFERLFGFVIELVNLVLRLCWRLVQIAWQRSATHKRHDGVEVRDRR